jgi:hypothetical protein
MRCVAALPMGLPVLLGLAAFAGCNATGAQSGADLAFGRVEEPVAAPAPVAAVGATEARVVDSLAPSAVPAAASRPVEAMPVAADSERDHERRLRHDLATAEDPVPAAIELVAWLCSEEQHEDALAVLDAALARRPADALRAVRVGVLRDLGRRHAAVAALRALRTDVGIERMAPRLLFELAELEWLEGDGPAAAATLRILVDTHAGDAFVVATADARKRLATEVAAGGKPERMRVRDVLGNLRGAPEAADRLQALDHLATPSMRAEDGGIAALAQAVAIGLGDPAEVVRARAVAFAEPEPELRAELVAAALDDPSPLVRQQAVARLAEWRPAEAEATAMQHLEHEADPTTFLALGRTLATWLAAPMPTLAQASSPAGRAEVVVSLRRRTQP